MNKKQIQQRVLKSGKPLDLDKFEWNEEARVFSTLSSGLVLDFSDISRVTFKTGSHCTFNTGHDCTFDTSSYCTFDTGSNCTFDTGSDCTFKTSYSCIFKTGYNCTFNTEEECVVIRGDIYEIIELEKDKKIKLNGYEASGYEVISSTKTITIDGKDIEIGEESFEELKKQLNQ